jgi:hypothetical protein
MSVVPFKRPMSQYEWLAAVVGKKQSSITRGKRPTLDELWWELVHDYDVNRVRERVEKYERRLKRVVG